MELGARTIFAEVIFGVLFFFEQGSVRYRTITRRRLRAGRARDNRHAAEKM